MGERTYTLSRRLRVRAGRQRAPTFEHVPTPPSERGHWLLAGAVAAIGAGMLVAVSTGLIGRSQPAPAAPPPVLAAAATPVPGEGSASRGSASGPSARAPETAGARGAARGTILARPSAAQQAQALVRLEDPLQTDIPARWIAGFYPIYAVAQSTFGVNWLLIASIHDQESAFSTAAGTYHGLNFAGCCGGPMQFNVTNGGTGTPSTWDLVRDSYIYGRRPASYDHMTARHPSIYDDFDAIMAAAHLLSADGATLALGGGAWYAAYDYYGHDATGVTYADQVLARAISWSQHGFCLSCGLDEAMVSAVHAAYGAPVLAQLQAQAAREEALRAARTRHARSSQARRPGARPGGAPAGRPARRAGAAG
jgi:hypothetical protein